MSGYCNECGNTQCVCDLELSETMTCEKCEELKAEIEKNRRTIEIAKDLVQYSFGDVIEKLRCENAKLKEDNKEWQEIACNKADEIDDWKDQADNLAWSLRELTGLMKRAGHKDYASVGETALADYEKLKNEK